MIKITWCATPSAWRVPPSRRGAHSDRVSNLADLVFFFYPRIMRKQWSSIRQSWRTFWGAHRRLRRALYPLVWLPTGIVFTELFYTMKYINGRSMQVCSLSIYSRLLPQMLQLASQRSILIRLLGGTSSYLTVSQYGRYVGTSEETWLH